VTSYSGADVKISWNIPSTGGSGITITKLDIQIQKKSDSSFNFYISGCDGTQASVITNNYCVVAMADITGATFGLA
jgi:hypothetical protein